MARGGCNYGTKRRLGLSVYYMIGQGKSVIGQGIILTAILGKHGDTDQRRLGDTTLPVHHTTPGTTQ